MTFVLDVALHLLDGIPFTSRDANVQGMDNSFLPPLPTTSPPSSPRPLTSRFRRRPSTTMSPFRSFRKQSSAAPRASPHRPMFPLPLRWLYLALLFAQVLLQPGTHIVETSQCVLGTRRASSPRMRPDTAGSGEC